MLSAQTRENLLRRLLFNMRVRKVLGLLLGVFALSLSALAADEYKIDPVHSSVNFAVTHMTISTVNGRFNDFAGTILFDDKDATKSSVTVTIKAASINTDNNNRHVKIVGRFQQPRQRPEIGQLF
jgi:polyisoprenoid-binding protein YceI